MESSNFHHQLQEQFVDQTPISFYGSTTTTTAAVGSNNSSTWNPNLILNGGNYFNLNVNGVDLTADSSRDGQNINDHNILVPPPSLINTASMFQDLGFHNCVNNTSSFTNTQSAAHELHLAKIKKELSISDSHHHPFKNQEQQFPHYIKQQLHHDQVVLQHQDLSDEHQKLLLKSYSSSGDLYSYNIHNNNNNNNTFSQLIFPSTNISNLIINPSSSSTSFSSSLGMNFQALDLLSSGSFGSQSSHNNNLGLSFDLDHLQGSSSSLWPSNNSNKMSAASLFMNGVGGGGGGGGGGTETKRSSNALEYSSTSSKATPHHTVVVPKKPRMESRSSSFPPFKVRKEKLGDRIATLQQLVAPFGKTDTASVLMEAIGYIKFLQDQVETLSVPYMKSVRTHSRIIVQRSQGCSSTEDVQEGNKEAKLQRDLRSRGLCLVPLTFITSYISGVDNVNVGAVWPPLPNFGGGSGA